MKKLILILALVLVALCVIACVAENRVNTPGGSTAPGETTTPNTEPTISVPPSSSVPVTTETMPDGWDLWEGNLYYYHNGKPLTGWQEVDGLRRYFHAHGALASGFVEIDGSLYYLDADGCIVTGWQEVEGERYYLDENGVVVTGWLQQDDGLYYLKEDGTMARGCLQIDGVNRYFTASGHNIVMVNPWNYVPEDYEPDLVKLDKFANYSDMYIDRDCYDELVAMLTACRSECSRAVVVSAYRTHEFQTKNYQRAVKQFLDRGYDQEEAQRLAAQEVAVPGTSEHQLGLAVDIVDVNYPYLTEKQEDMPAQKWLMEHSWEYGFILRYPNDKTSVTGIIYEPWHYRYVGKELAKELTDLGLTLEEYLDALTQKDE